MDEVPGEPAATRVQLCGSFVAELGGRRVDTALPGRQARLLFAYLTLERIRPVPRDRLIAGLWDEAPPPEASAALSVLLSKIRTVVGPGVLRGRSALRLVLPEPAQVDVEIAVAALHTAESQLAQRQWARAWASSLTARFTASRPFFAEADTGWAESWRRRLADLHLRALEAYGTACLELGGTELGLAEATATELVDLAPLRETGHLLLMRTLAERGNPAEAVRAYGRLRGLLRDELGVDPSPPAQELYATLLG